MEPSQSRQPAAQDKERVSVNASFEPLIPRFLSNRKKEVTAMQEALIAQDFEMIRRISHGMKGVGGSYGFDRITEMAAAIEQAATAGAMEDLHKALDQLAVYLKQVQVVLE
jgi:HPt (histidine-containing phosphotransfer) domain-containing protein